MPVPAETVVEVMVVEELLFPPLTPGGIHQTAGQRPGSGHCQDAISLVEAPAAAAPAGSTLLMEISALAVCPFFEAVTLDLKPSLDLIGPQAVCNRPALRVSDGGQRLPARSQRPARALGRQGKNYRRAAATGPRFLSSTCTMGSRAVRCLILLIAPSPSTMTRLSFAPGV